MQREVKVGYCGRFAPTPSGDLHFGSLIAALGSYLQARAAQGQWHVRIDDVDPPRNVVGSADKILKTLAELGLEWDGPVVYQSQRLEAYRAALGKLRLNQLLFGCDCSRKVLQSAGIRNYPGTCRVLGKTPQPPWATRVRAQPMLVDLHDALQGEYSQEIARNVGDFVVQRADGAFAYHLATVVDDADLGVTEVVRGADLLESTPRQIFLQRLLGLPTPKYCHLPIAVDQEGQKLSKQNLAPPIHLASGGSTWLCRALTFLGHTPPLALEKEKPESVLAWALQHWTLEKVPRVFARPANSEALTEHV